MILPRRAVFGDYSILFNLKSNMIFRVKDDPNCRRIDQDARTNKTDTDMMTFCMATSSDVLLNLCELYP